MNNKERLSRLIAQYQKNMEFYRNAREFNEQDCRDEFISPLLESFGWDVHNEKGTSPQYKEVVVEKFSNSGDRPDYTLTLNGVSKIFVEAKKPAVNIKEEQEPAIQARRYGWNAKHKLSILTNFEDMMIYDVTNKPQDGDSATVSLYRKYHYLEYLKKYEEIYELISRESVYTGKYDKYVEDKFPNEERYSTEVDEVFLKQINKWRLEIGDYLYRTDNTYKDTADTWYQYGRTQALTAFVNTPKLIVRILSKEPMYAYDENDMLIASGGTAGYCAIAKLPDSKYDLRYIQAWLNHPYTEKLFQIMGSDFEGGFIARGTYLLKKIPFVELDFDDEKQKVLYESVLTSTKKINELNIVLEQKKDKASISVIEAEKENLSKQIEDNITKIYNLQF